MPGVRDQPHISWAIRIASIGLTGNAREEAKGVNHVPEHLQIMSLSREGDESRMA